MRILTGRQIQINSIRFSPDGHYLTCDGCTPIFQKWYVNVWQVHGAESPKHTVEGQFKHGDGFALNKRQPLLFLSGQRIALSIATGKVVSNVPPLNTCEMSPDRKWKVSHESDYLSNIHRLRAEFRVGRRDVERWTRVFPHTPAPTGHDFDGQRESFVRVEFTANGTRVLGVFKRYGNFAMEVAVQRLNDGLHIEEEIVRALDTETGEDVGEWRGGKTTLFGPNGELIQLRRASLHVLYLLNPHQPAVTRTNSSGEDFTAAAFSPDGKLLATTSNDTTVTMWDTTTWEPIRQYGWEVGRLRAVAFAPDGLTCAAGSDTGKVVLFDVDG